MNFNDFVSSLENEYGNSGSLLMADNEYFSEESRHCCSPGCEACATGFCNANEYYSPRKCDGKLGKVRSRKQRCLQQQLHQRHAANLRERKRMLSINEAFEGLRHHIPTLPYEKRLSKVDTLRLAIGYIHFLTELVEKDNNSKENVNKTSSNVPKKVIIHCHRVFEESAMFSNQQPLVGHSLSWKDESKINVGPNNKMVAKIWIPEDPRKSPKKTQDDTISTRRGDNSGDLLQLLDSTVEDDCL